MNKSATTLALLLSLSASLPAAYGQAPASAAPGAEAQAKADQEIDQKAAEWVAALRLPDARKEAAVRQTIATHLRAVREYNNAHPYTETPAGLNPSTGQPLSTLDRQLIAVSGAMPKSVHENLMNGLRQYLTPEQVEAVLDKYTIGKVAFTLNGYKAIVPDLTPAEEQVIVANLKQAREQAVDFKSMKEISAVFEIYKTKNEEYLNTHGRNWRELFRTYVAAAKARKAAEKAPAPAASPK